jgi:hypothetical protein
VHALGRHSCAAHRLTIERRLGGKGVELARGGALVDDLRTRNGTAAPDWP